MSNTRLAKTINLQLAEGEREAIRRLCEDSSKSRTVAKRTCFFAFSFMHGIVSIVLRWGLAIGVVFLASLPLSVFLAEPVLTYVQLAICAVIVTFWRL